MLTLTYISNSVREIAQIKNNYIKQETTQEVSD